MGEEANTKANPAERGKLTSAALWAGGAWALPWLVLAACLFPQTSWPRAAGILIAVAAAAAPALFYARRQKRLLLERAAKAEEAAAQMRLQLEMVRSRTAQLREELKDNTQEAKRANLLVLLGQFTAGFMHEFNNPLAIVAGRLEVLREERRDDAALCADLDQMLHETRYMTNIAKTMLQALRRERAVEPFEPAAPQEAVSEALAALRPSVEEQNVKLIVEMGETPHVDLPNHIIDEVLRGMLGNALKAVKGKDDGAIWICLESYRPADARVQLRIEDNGPGVPEQVRPHLFEPFVTQNLGKEKLGMGLGLFLAASLLDMYDGRIRYENREGVGASFVLEMPPARFVHGQPYHWFAGGATG
jgi:two-component system C4-dicarboxylate transport sensor histidine kinase DctB